MRVSTTMEHRSRDSRSKSRLRMGIAFIAMLAVVTSISARALNAHAATDTTGFIWTVDENVSTYRHFVDTVRNSFPVVYDTTRESERGARGNMLITLINPAAQNSNNLIRLQLELDNLYIVGWDTGPGTLFRYGTNPVPTDFPADGNREQLQMDLNYGNTRQGLNIGMGATQAAIDTLANFRNGDRNSDPARRALIVLAQVLSEAIRFVEIENGVANAWVGGHTVADAEMQIENDWDLLSGLMLGTLDDPTRTFTYTDPFSNLPVTTLAGLAAILGLIYINAVKR
jgi:Ribosome inactivating protein